MGIGLPDYDSQHELYDLIYGNYAEDLPFYLHEAKKARGAVLEVGCGTGRILLRLLSEGVDAYGIDISQSMVAQLERKARKIGISTSGRIKIADMRKFFFRKKFSLAIVPFRVFLHLLTTSDQLSALKCIRKSLKKGGRMILNFFLPSAKFICSNYNKKVSWQAYGKPASSIAQNPAKSIRVVDFTRYENEPEQIIKVCQTVYEGKKKLGSYSFRLSLIYKREFELLLRAAGFSKWRVYGGFKKQKLVSSKQEMVWEAFR
ncbi:MAG: class I SAM-dependent methyltransferase [Candidatus Anstonellaceae archaeon]